MQIIEKKWGKEYILEINDNYVVKMLFMKKGHRCSLQYHENKKETFIITSGIMNFYYEKNNKIEVIQLTQGSFYTIAPGIKHRMEAVEDLYYFECSTSHLDDVIRLEDDYGRV